MLKDSWIDKIDGKDDAMANDINEIAHTVIENETKIQAINERSTFLYKGTVGIFSQLDSESKQTGDVWTVEQSFLVKKKVDKATLTGVSYDEDFYLSTLFIFDSLPTNVGQFQLYDPDTKACIAELDAGYSSDDTAEYYGEFPGWSSLPCKEYYLIWYDNSLNTDEVSWYPTGENSKVFWDGEKWQPFTGELSIYATKEEVGQIETALNRIEALQNSYIGGESI